jgi:hypothetical protein
LKRLRMMMAGELLDDKEHASDTGYEVEKNLIATLTELLYARIVAANAPLYLSWLRGWRAGGTAAGFRFDPSRR